MTTVNRSHLFLYARTAAGLCVIAFSACDRSGSKVSAPVTVQADSVGPVVTSASASVPTVEANETPDCNGFSCRTAHPDAQSFCAALAASRTAQRIAEARRVNGEAAEIAIEEGSDEGSSGFNIQCARTFPLEGTTAQVLEITLGEWDSKELLIAYREADGSFRQSARVATIESDMSSDASYRIKRARTGDFMDAFSDEIRMEIETKTESSTCTDNRGFDDTLLTHVYCGIGKAGYLHAPIELMCRGITVEQHQTITDYDEERDVKRVIGTRDFTSTVRITRAGIFARTNAHGQMRGAVANDSSEEFDRLEEIATPIW